jgi:hypothetical protein
MDMCKPFRPRSGACHRCFHLRPSGEASQPGLRAPAGTLTPNPARTLLRFGCVRSTSARSASRLSVGDRWPCATGLASYPSSCVHHLNRTTPFSVPPAARILSRLRGHRRFPGVFLSDRSIRDGPYPFSPAGCDTGRIQRLRFSLSRTAGWRTATLAHSSNCRFSPTVFTPCSETSERGA